MTYRSGSTCPRNCPDHNHWVYCEGCDRIAGHCVCPNPADSPGDKPD